MSTGGAASPVSIERAQRRAQALALRLAGNTFAQIGAALGVSEQRAHKLVTEELKRINERRQTDAEELRRLEEERIDALLAELWPLTRTRTVAVPGKPDEDGNPGPPVEVTLPPDLKAVEQV